MSRLILSHGIVGKPQALTFDPTRNHTVCRICGACFQPALDRIPLDQVTPETIFAALIERQEWSRKHARTHPQRQHDALARSGRFATPDATVKLASLGISPVSDMVFDEESAQAALEAPRCPTDDVETTLKGGIAV